MTPLDQAIAEVENEPEHGRRMNDNFVYFAALAETRKRGRPSELCDLFPEEFPTHLDEQDASRLNVALRRFIEECPYHPNVASAFMTLHKLEASAEMKSYFIQKLRFYCAQGDAHTVFQLCIELEDMGCEIFRTEAGELLPSRSWNEAELNLQVARRFLQANASDDLQLVIHAAALAQELF